MRRILVALAVAMALVVVPAAPSSVAMSVDTFDQRLKKQTNKARTANDVRALRHGKCLDRYAQRQARRMARQQRMYHQNLSVVLRACRSRTVGENVAYGFRTPKSNIRGWLNSPGHRKNMLSRKFTRIGIGVAKDSDGRTYTVQVFGRPA
ncbi:CAP domain-containing protein [Aeromicrobium sp.]|uniref:CAP domain-containing protein n=1 Tax=Aeromicrobium sp. TaxID=1871063 RepID=UPI0028AE5509|nr:CAP domain-containing protein [Aeromicrobium sp.]